METVEGRLKARMETLGMSGRRLAKLTGDSQSNVARWLDRGGAPADFLLRCEEAGVARAAWLLTGEGAPDASETEAQALLERIRELVAPTRPASNPAEILDDDDLIDEAGDGGTQERRA